MFDKPLDSFIVSDILSDDIGRNRGLTIGRYHILLILDKNTRLSFLEIITNINGSRSRLSRDLEWLIIRRIVSKETYKGSEIYSISEKGKYLLVLLQEYEDGAEAAETNQSVILPLMERLRSTSTPIAQFLTEFAEEYEKISFHLKQKAQLIRETIKEEIIEE